MNNKVRHNYLSIPSAAFEVWEWISNFIPHFIIQNISHNLGQHHYVFFIKGKTKDALKMQNTPRTLFSIAHSS